MSVRGLGSALLALAVTATASPAQDYRVTNMSREPSGEPDVTVSVVFGAGQLTVKPGSEQMLYRSRLRYDAEAFRPLMRYDAASRHLRVGIEGLKSGGRRTDGTDELRQELDLEVSPSVPTDLDMEFGAGTADVELGGLSLTGARIKAGAAESAIRFSRPNRIACRSLVFDVGAIQLTTEHLGNARCSRVSLKGAAGDLTLDLTGAWAEGTASRVDVVVGLGSVTLVLPEQLGVSVEVKRVFSTFDRSGLRRVGDRYYSANYESASVKVDIDVKAVMGGVEIRWARE